jgi:phage terminase large subunit-like protein
VTLGFDGSVSRDATALWAYELMTGRLVELGYWQRPPHVKSWSVPRAEVVAAIDAAFGRLDVLALFADPWFWRSELEQLAKRHGPERVVHYNTGSRARMAPATDAFLTAMGKGELLTDGSPTLRAHALSVVAKHTADGPVVVKDARHPLLIDAFLAALLAYEAWRSTPEVVKPAIW